MQHIIFIFIVLVYVSPLQDQASLKLYHVFKSRTFLIQFMLADCSILPAYLVGGWSYQSSASSWLPVYYLLHPHTIPHSYNMVVQFHSNITYLRLLKFYFCKLSFSEYLKVTELYLLPTKQKIETAILWMVVETKFIDNILTLRCCTKGWLTKFSQLLVKPRITLLQLL